MGFFFKIIKTGNIIPKQTVCVRLCLLIDSFNQLSDVYAIVTTAHAQ